MSCSVVVQIRLQYEKRTLPYHSKASWSEEAQRKAHGEHEGTQGEGKGAGYTHPQGQRQRRTNAPRVEAA